MTPESEASRYRASARRIASLIGVLGVAGTIYAAIVGGWRAGLGFAVGAAASGFSFWRWKAVVEGLGPAPGRASYGRWIGRFLLIAAAAYVIVKYLVVNIVAVLAGLLVAAAAVIFEIVFQLFHPGD